MNLFNLKRENNETYLEGIYKNPVHNIIDYEKNINCRSCFSSSKYSEEEIAKPKKRKENKKEK